MRHGVLKPILLGVLCALAMAIAGGCAWETVPDESEGARPSADTLDELRDAGRYNPIYWLGDEFAGLEISGAAVSDGNAWVSYGKRSCDPGSGCMAFPIEIVSTTGWPNPYLPPAKRAYTCFEHVRSAVLIEDCRNTRHPASQWGALHTGPSPRDARSGFGNSNLVTLSISGSIGPDNNLTIADLARRIYPITSSPQRPGPLPPPEPVPCPRLEYLVRWWVVANLREIGPNPNCGLSELLGLR
jgi:hypothetical protein